ncbi:Heat-labile enterotoxin, A chain [Akanthomyces lecanii RCEF 1005]|uniref:Heat-labile enterotoxin, A chain n=1 Tax=Akanthomyces lecanii RCEF 1005 TaxID=1081108 RepID=A0A168C6D0_CORDF|nr:Heat-labile enterotoxin, A chain [Akanthomyces lecanii RCEF 1005]
MMNPWHWTTAALAFVTVSVQGAALPVALGETRPLRPARAEGDHSDLNGHLHGRQQALPVVVFRGSGSSPESVKERGGFIPRARDESEPISNTTFGLQSHHIGEKRTLYTSTTRDLVMGVTFALQSEKSSWVYRIHPTPNMIDLNDSGFEIRFKREEEFSALGGIRYDQIEAWAEVTYTDLIGAGLSKFDFQNLVDMQPIEGELPALNFTTNPDYNAKYDNLSASPGQPQLAGDEANLAKFNEKSLEGYAIEFMEKNGGPVGWDGKFPLSALTSDAPAEPTTPREREDKLCANSDADFSLTKAECRTQVAQCVFEEGTKPNFDWSLITACMDAKWRII